MRTPLFDGNDRYTDEALDLDRELARALREIFRKGFAQGFSIRDRGNVAHGAVFDVQNDLLILNPPEKGK